MRSVHRTRVVEANKSGYGGDYSGRIVAHKMTRVLEN